MSRRGLIAGGIVLVGALAGLAWLLFSPHQPVYQGKPLTSWMDQYQEHILANQKSADRPKRDQAEAAIRQIGTNALPTLLRMAGAKDSALKKKLIALGSKQSVIPLHFQPPNFFHAKATYGFGPLGA